MAIILMTQENSLDELVLLYAVLGADFTRVSKSGYTRERPLVYAAPHCYLGILMSPSSVIIHSKEMRCALS